MIKETRIYNGEKTVSSMSGVGKNWTTTCKRMNLEHFLSPNIKVNSKLIKYLNVSLETIKLWGENISRILFDINRSNSFLDLSPKAKKTKAKIDKWDLIKLKSFCTAKETTAQSKKQPTVWEKIFANDMTNEGLISKIYKQLIQINVKKQSN